MLKNNGTLSRNYFDKMFQQKSNMHTDHSEKFTVKRQQIESNHWSFNLNATYLPIRKDLYYHWKEEVCVYIECIE